MAATPPRPIQTQTHAPRIPATDPIALSWLVTVRWTTILAGLGALAAGRDALAIAIPLGPMLAVLAASGLSNLWLMWRVRAGRPPAFTRIAGLLVSSDVLVLSWLLLRSGGVLNPASVYYLVLIVVAALALGRTWTGVITALSIAGYAALFLRPTAELRNAQTMHPEIALHMRGMWFAFAVTALLIGLLVTRLAVAIERRDRALETLREKSARAARLAGLATLAAGAAHELGTPLGTIAVAARELERALDTTSADPALTGDARLIRTEIDRCQRLLADMAGRMGEVPGEAPREVTVEDVLHAIVARVAPDERARVHLAPPPAVRVVWPVGAVALAAGNVVRNALQNSPPGESVRLEASTTADGRVQVSTVDHGRGMSAAELARAGEPFFTTRSPRGTGLGLFVARSTIEQLGGSLTLTSIPDRGTTVTIALPRDVVTARTDADE